ncbi:MAG TPA: HAMP domain-containing sensor histidine kinase [Anaeromyxobacteraceae bacterium]|jgi:signal transduction histidine kinase|nr:HAMP domain-containing sensor histidine kinase [Anaeromyxobacteraceae bacterium]
MISDPALTLALRLSTAQGPREVALAFLEFAFGITGALAGAVFAVGALDAGSQSSAPRALAVRAPGAAGHDSALQQGLEGAAGVAWASGSPVWELPASGGPRTTISGWAAIPLRAASAVLGACSLAFAPGKSATPEQRRLLEAAAEACAGALPRALAYQRACQERDEAIRAAERQERALAMVGHDLRTPLSAVVLASSLVARLGSLNAGQSRAVARIESSAGKMHALIRDLLDFSRIRGTGGMTVYPEPARLDEICARAAGELRETHPRGEIRLELEPLEGRWDPLRIEQVVANLLSNALQYGLEGAPVALRLRADGARAVLEVHNRGAIPEPLIPEIFEPFRKGPHRRRASLGLGLFIVREIARAHGGEVSVTSSVDRGTTFAVRLPGARPAAG